MYTFEYYSVDFRVVEPKEGQGDVYLVRGPTGAQALAAEGSAHPEKEERKALEPVEEVNLDRFTPHINEQARAILAKHSDVWKGKLGEIKTTERRIELLPGNIPIRQIPFRKCFHERKFEKQEIEKMLKESAICPSKSDWASPVVLAPKGDSGLRF